MGELEGEEREIIAIPPPVGGKFRPCQGWESAQPRALPLQFSAGALAHLDGDSLSFGHKQGMPVYRFRPRPDLRESGPLSQVQ